MSFAGLVAGLLDGLEDDLEGLVVGLEVGGEAALVADGGVEPALLEHALEGVEDLGAPAQGLARSSARRSGMIMNSWKSTLLSACAPPLRMFIIGTGRTLALAPPR